LYSAFWPALGWRPNCFTGWCVGRLFQLWFLAVTAVP